MNIDFIHRIGLMVFFILVQVLILNHIHLFNVATPLVYVYFILLFPRNQQHWVSVLWAFFFGLILVSVYYVGKTVKKYTFLNILLLIIGAVLAYGMSIVSHANENDTLSSTFV